MAATAGGPPLSPPAATRPQLPRPARNCSAACRQQSGSSGTRRAPARTTASKSGSVSAAAHFLAALLHVSAVGWGICAGCFRPVGCSSTALIKDRPRYRGSCCKQQPMHAFGARSEGGCGLKRDAVAAAGTQRTEDGWHTVGPWMNSPAMGTTHAKQGLDKRFLPDRCGMSMTSALVTIQGTPLSRVCIACHCPCKVPVPSSARCLQLCTICSASRQHNHLSARFACRRLPPGVKAGRAVPGWIGVRVEEGEVWSPDYTGTRLCSRPQSARALGITMQLHLTRVYDGYFSCCMATCA